MFATVEFNETENNLKNRFKRLFFREKIITERVNLPEYEYFYRLKVPVYKGKIPWEKLRRLNTCVSDGMIFQNNFTPDKDIKVYFCSWFRDMLLFNSAVSYLEKNNVNPAETVITLIDKKGVLHTEAECLVHYAGEIKVITDNVKAYSRTAERLMRDYGLSLFVSDKLSSISEDGIIISPDSSVIPLRFKGILITCKKRLLPFARVLTGEGIKADEAYKMLCPEGINMTEFISALCEVCFVKELRKSEYEKLVDISL